MISKFFKCKHKYVFRKFSKLDDGTIVRITNCRDCKEKLLEEQVEYTNYGASLVDISSGNSIEVRRQ